MRKVGIGSSILLFVILYIYLYNPVFAWPGFGFVNVLLFFAIVYAFLHLKKFWRYIIYFKKEFCLTLIMIGYAYFRTRTPESNAADMIPIMIIWVLTTLVVSIYIIDGVLSKVKNFVFFDAVLKVAFFAAVISILAMLIPPLNTFVRGIQSSVELDVSEHVSDYRMYGLATNLTSSYGYVQGVLASYCLLYYSRNPRKYTIYFFALSLATAINARTGLIPIIIAIAYMLIRNRKRIRIQHVIVTLLTGIALLPFINKFMSSDSPIVESIRAFFIAIYSFVIKGDANAEGGTYFSVLADEIIFPSTQDLLFGSGITLFGAFEDLGMRSDIMYINQLFIGGIVFLAIIMTYVIVFYRKMWIMNEKQFFPILLLIMALLANFKGSAFYVGNAFTRFVMLFYFVLAYNNMNKNKHIDVE